MFTSMKLLQYCQNLLLDFHFFKKVSIVEKLRIYKYSYYYYYNNFYSYTYNFSFLSGTSNVCSLFTVLKAGMYGRHQHLAAIIGVKQFLRIDKMKIKTMNK